MMKYEAVEYLQGQINESKENYIHSINLHGVDKLIDKARKVMFLKEILNNNDLGFDGYSLECHKQGIVTTYKLICNGWIAQVMMIVNNKQVGFDILTMFLELIQDELEKVTLLSRGLKSRINRNNRASTELWRDIKACEFLDVLDTQDTNEVYEPVRYDNKMVSEILPAYRLTLQDSIGDRIELLR